MRVIGEFISYVMYTFGALMYGAPITLGALAFIAVAVKLNYPLLKARRDHKNWILFAPFISTLTILAFAAIMRHDTSAMHRAPAWPAHVILGFFSIHLPLMAILLWKLRVIFLTAFTINIFAIYMSACAVFISMMAVSGDWL